MSNRNRLNILLFCFAFAVTTGVAGTSFAQQTLYLTTDPAAVAACWDIADDGDGIKSVYVMVGDFGATRFAIEEDAGVTMTYIGETHLVGGTTGTVHGGLSVCPPECPLQPPTALVRIDYMSHGTSQTCSEIRIVPAPGFDGVDIRDCNGNNYGARIFSFFVNRVYPYCPVLCEHEPHVIPPSSTVFSCEPVPVDESTWGRIKALYE